MNGKIIAEKKQWEGAEDIHVAKKRAKKEPAQMPKPTQEPPSKAKKDEEIKLPTHKDVKEEAKVMVPDLPSYKKIQPHEVIPLLRGTLSKILEHKDPNKVSSADLKVIEGCLEQTILQEVPVQVLIDSKVGILVKEFYDFVHKNPQLKMLDIIARCAFKKLKKRVCEMLFGITKTLQYIPKEQPVETVEIISSVERSSPLRIKRKDKMEQKEEQRVKREMPDAQRWYMLRTRDVAPKMSQSEVEENIHKPPVNPRLASRVIEKLAKLLQDVSNACITQKQKRFKGKNEAKEIAKNIEWYMRIFDTTMGTTYKRWVEKIENLLRTWKGKPDGALVIDRIHEILPIAPPDVKVPF
eukprot:TRINITY_DN139_c0_g1_i5.p1 TRINITY_DN139_c0_g1~~TRINITY_DN139_c0_g1_i5.p1  ORF type:complete len:353 (+),score=55.45 TRINITY_DN139_c0_g1_i5:427-1485(+)